MPLSEPLNKVGKLASVYKVTWNLKQEITYLGVGEGTAPVEETHAYYALSPELDLWPTRKRDDLLWVVTSPQASH